MPGPSDAQTAVEEFRDRIARQEARASAQMVRAYAPVYTRLQSDTRALMQVAKTRGLKPWQVMRMQRLKDLERQFLVNADRFAKQAGSIITESQRAAVGLARQGALSATTAGLPQGVTMDNMANLGLGWNRLPDDAFQNFVGIAGDGAPLGNLLAPLGPEAVTGVRDKIGEGIALGKGPRETANLVATAAGMPLSRALLITRTETNRAFREATRLEYRNNSRVVKGYRRHADHSDRTCVACIALDGKLYSLDQSLDEHPNGRCALVPEVLDYADLGLDMPRTPPPDNARDWLAGQSEGVQRDILGGTRFDAWRAGEIELNQLAIVRPHPVWGDTAVVRPLNELTTRSGTPIRQVGAPPSALRRRPPPPEAVPLEPPPKPPPPSPTAELIDPQTGLAVRGSRTAPPDIDDLDELGAVFDFDANRFVRQSGPPIEEMMKDTLLDRNPAWHQSIINSPLPAGRPGREILRPSHEGVPNFLTKAIGEQEAWARAAGGALEVDYAGMSLQAARQTNLALEQTIVRHQIRPLERVMTTPKKGGRFDGATAYMTREGGIHINVAEIEFGSTRSLAAGAKASNLRTATTNARIREAAAQAPRGETAYLEKELFQKRTTLEALQKQRKDYILAQRNAGTLDASEARDWIRYLESAEKENRVWLKRCEKALKEHIAKTKKEALKIKPTQWFTSGSVDEGAAWIDTVTHEIGHYYHRRFGFNDTDALSVLSKKSKIQRNLGLGWEKAYDRRGNWTGRRAAGDDAYSISEYAATNDREFFAEAFADYYQGGARITKKMSDFIEEVIKVNRENPTFNIKETNAIGLNARSKGLNMRAGEGQLPLKPGFEYPSDEW